MKNKLTSLFAQVKSGQMVNNTTEVKEMLTEDCCCEQQCKRFTAVDLWNIQRHGKAKIQRRMF